MRKKPRLPCSSASLKLISSDRINCSSTAMLLARIRYFNSSTDQPGQLAFLLFQFLLSLFNCRQKSFFCLNRHVLAT